MKKLFTILLLGIFFISFANALDFDNGIKYYNDDLDVDFENGYFFGIGDWIGLSEKIGEIELKSHKSVDEVLKFIPGTNKVTMYYDFNFKNEYKNGLGDVEFINMRTGEVVKKDYNFVIEKPILEEVNNYSEICKEIFIKENNTYLKDCSNILTGTHLEEVGKEWVELDVKDIPNEKVRIGLQTSVIKDDYIDAIWTITGKKIKKHASWTSANCATGGTLYIDGDYCVNTFTSNGNLSIPLNKTLNATVLIVAGGGTGGYARGGGGGAGGLIYNNSYLINGNITAIVGVGGIPSTSNIYGTNATNSSFGVLEAHFGGQGGSSDGAFTSGLNGGSGGGVPNSGNTIGQGISGQGYAGGDGYSPSPFRAGGGGGAGGLGTSGATSGNGGIGFTTSINGTSICYAGGGGGGANGLTPGTGTCGGGNGGQYSGANPTSGVDGLGGGAGGNSYGTGASGGDGIVIVRYEAFLLNNLEVTLNSPNDSIQTTNENVTFNCSATDETGVINLTLKINGVDNYTVNDGGVGNINLSLQTNLTLEEGIYNWTCSATDGIDIIEETNRTLTIHLTEPGVIIHNPKPIIDYHLLGNNLTLNWTVSEPGENLTEHIKNCTYEYNGTVTVLNNTVCTQINNTQFEYILGVNNLTFNVTDSFDLVNSTLVSWNIKLTEINQTYNNETTEGSLETFLANIKLGDGYSISDAVLISYNGTEETGQSFTSGSNTILRKTNFLIPNVATDTNVTFYWNITLSDSTNLNLSSKNQTIYNLNIDNCSSNTVELFNFSVVDEELQTILPNATIEIAINIYDQPRETLILNYSKQFQKVNPVRICINRNISSDTFYSVDTVVRYEDTESANEYYNIINQSLTNGTESQKITLYDLNLTDSTDFQLSFTGSDFLPVENALVYVDRQYISENTFKTVELPKTDYNGQSVLHLVRNDVIYNIRIIKDGVVLGNFENLVAFCDDFTIGDCNIELNAFDSVESIFNFDEELGIIYTSPVYNETASTISFNFVTEDGTAKTVSLNVTRNDIFGNRSVCNSSLTSSGGTLTCNIDPNLDESVLMVSIYVDGVLTVSGSVELDTDNFGVAGYLVMFVMAMSFIFMFSGSKTGVLISIGLTFAGALGMGIISGELIGVGASGIWLLVIIFVGIYKLNKDRNS